MGAEVDDSSQRGVRGGRRRYFLAAVLRRERDARARRLRICHAQQPGDAAERQAGSEAAPAKRLSLPVPAYMPLAGDDAGGTGAPHTSQGANGPSNMGPLMSNPCKAKIVHALPVRQPGDVCACGMCAGERRAGMQGAAAGTPVGVGAEKEEEAKAAGESLEQRALEKTRRFNEALRARPHELQLWLDFAAWQDELAQCACSALHAHPAVHAVDRVAPVLSVCWP